MDEDQARWVLERAQSGGHPARQPGNLRAGYLRVANPGPLGASRTASRTTWGKSALVP